MRSSPASLRHLAGLCLLAGLGATPAWASIPDMSPLPAFVAPRHRAVAIMAADDTVAMLDWADGRVIQRFCTSPWLLRAIGRRPIRTFALAPDEAALYALCHDGTIAAWALGRTGIEPPGRLRWWSTSDRRNGAWDLQLSADGRTLAACGTDGYWVEALDAATGATRRRWRDADYVFDVAPAPDGETVVWTRRFGSLASGEVATGRVRDLGPGGGPLLFAADGTLLYMQGRERRRHAVSRDPATGGIRRLEGVERPLRRLPDGRMLVAGDGRGIDGRALDVRTGKAARLWSLAASEDHRTIDGDPVSHVGVSTSWRGDTRVVDTRTGRERFTYQARDRAMQWVSRTEPGGSPWGLAREGLEVGLFVLFCGWAIWMARDVDRRIRARGRVPKEPRWLWGVALAGGAALLGAAWWGHTAFPPLKDFVLETGLPAFAVGYGLLAVGVGRRAAAEAEALPMLAPAPASGPPKPTARASLLDRPRSAALVIAGAAAGAAVVAIALLVLVLVAAERRMMAEEEQAARTRRPSPPTYEHLAIAAGGAPLVAVTRGGGLTAYELGTGAPRPRTPALRLGLPAVSADGRRLAALDGIGKAIVVLGPDGVPRHTVRLPGEWRHARALAFGPDDRTLVAITASDERTLLLIDAAMGRIRAERPLGEVGEGHRLDPTGRYLALDGRPATVWDLATARRVGTLAADAARARAGRGHDEGGLHHVAGFLPGERLLTCMAVGERLALQTWDWRRGRVLATRPLPPPGPDWAPTAPLEGRLLAAPDGRHLALLARDALAMWDVAAGRWAWELALEPPHVDAVFTPDGRSIAVAAYQQLRLLDAATGQARWTKAPAPTPTPPPPVVD